MSAKDMVSKGNGPAIRMPAWVGLVGVLAAGPLATTGVARAANPIETVELTKAGPKTPVPLRQEFYLQGDAPDKATSVHAVFVRYRYAPWGLAPRGEGRARPSTCTEVQAAIGVAQPPSDELLARGGVMKLEELWPADATVNDKETEKGHLRALSNSQERVYVAPQSLASDFAGEAGKKKWKTLVSNKEFFRPGARYCLFVISQTPKTLTKEEIDGVITGFEDAVRACPKQDYDACVESAARTTLVKVEQLGFDAATQEKVEAELKKDKLGAIATVVEAEAAIKAILASWTEFQNAAKVNEKTLEAAPKPAAPQDLVGRRIALEVNGSNAAHAALASLILRALANDEAHQLDHVDAGYVAYKDKQRFVIDALEISFANDSGLSNSLKLTGRGLDAAGRPSDDKKMQVTATFELALDDVRLPLARGAMSLEDLLQFLVGRVRIKKGVYVPFNQVLAEDKDALSSLGPNKTRNALTTAAHGLLDVMRELRTAEAAAVGGDTFPSGTFPYAANLHTLLTELGTFKSCKDIVKPEGGPDLACRPSKPLKKVFVDWWPGYASEKPKGDSHNPLYVLAQQLDTIESSIAPIEEARVTLRANLATTIKKVEGPTPELEIDLTQKAFFSTYVTEVAGLAWLPGHADTTAAKVGFQVFLWPNLVEEPMWSNGVADFRRFVGAELGLRTSAEAYGPAKRFGPLPNSGIPPFFAGGVLQILPYTTVGSGVAVFGYRRSVLEDERARTRAAWYVSINVQFNFAAIIRKLAKGESPAIPTE